MLFYMEQKDAVLEKQPGLGMVLKYRIEKYSNLYRHFVSSDGVKQDYCQNVS